MDKKQIETYLRDIENFYSERIFSEQIKEKISSKQTRNFITEKTFLNYFKTYYLDPKSRIEDEIQDTIEIPDYDKKVFYLFKHFPYPDLIKTIIKKLKFLQFQEQFILRNLTKDLERNIEQHLLIETMEKLTELTSNYKHINNVK